MNPVTAPIIGIPCDRTGRPLRQPTREEDQEFVDRAQAGDKQARNTLILGHRALVPFVMSRMRYPQTFQEDMMQEGMLGLARAVDLYHGRQFGTKFASYAFLWVRSTLTKCLNRSIKHMRYMPAGTQGSLTDYVDHAGLEILGGKDDGADPETSLILRDIKRQIEKAAADIMAETGDERITAVLNLRVFAEAPLSATELGVKLGMTTEGARVYARRAMSAICERVEAMEIDDD